MNTLRSAKHGGMIRVGVDAWNLLDDHRGIGRYLRTTLDLLQSDFADRVACTLVIPEWPVMLAARRYHAELPGSRYPIVARRWVSRRSVDLMWFPFNGPSWERFPQPSVATLHDGFVFDDPNRANERRQFLAARDHCTAIVTDSVYSQRELMRHLGLPSERINVVHLGTTALPEGPASLDPAAFGTYVLFVGEISHRKGFDVLVAAMRALAERGTPLTLVMAGRALEALPDLGGVDVRVLGHVDDATLGALYRGCLVFAFPSRAEGFGLPVLEAMLAGAPVITTSATSLPEVAGDAALYVPPDDADALAIQIARIASEPQLAAELRARGFTRAAEMTWKRSTEHLVTVFERTVHAYPETRASRASRLFTR